MIVQNKSLYYIRIAFCVIAAAVMFFPVYWLITSSLKPENILLNQKVSVSLSDITFNNYVNAIRQKRFWGFLVNSVIVAISATSIVILLSMFGAYSLARMRFPGRDIIANSVLFIYMVPPVLLSIPLYIWMYKLGLLDSRVGIIFAHVTRGLPFALWMLRGFFQGLPKELEDSARIDGCNILGILFKIILPISGSGIVAVATYTVILSWNDYLMAFMLITKGSLQTLPVGLVVMYENTDVIDIPGIMAGSVLSTIPVVAFFYLVQKFLVKGMTAGAVKG